jgi:hypothetical protein
MVTRGASAFLMTGTIIAGAFMTGNLFTADVTVFFLALGLFLSTFLKGKNS